MSRLIIFNIVVALLIYVTIFFNLKWFAISIFVALILFDCFVFYFEKNLLGGAGGLESEFEDYEDNIEETKKDK